MSDKRSENKIELASILKINKMKNIDCFRRFYEGNGKITLKIQNYN